MRVKPNYGSIPGFVISSETDDDADIISAFLRFPDTIGGEWQLRVLGAASGSDGHRGFNFAWVRQPDQAEAGLDEKE